MGPAVVRCMICSFRVQCSVKSSGGPISDAPAATGAPRSLGDKAAWKRMIKRRSSCAGATGSWAGSCSCSAMALAKHPCPGAGTIGSWAQLLCLEAPSQAPMSPRRDHWKLGADQGCSGMERLVGHPCHRAETAEAGRGAGAVLKHAPSQAPMSWRRDHRKLGAELELFSINEAAGSGLVFWHPKGAMVRHVIEDYWRQTHLARGYQLLFTCALCTSHGSTQGETGPHSYLWLLRAPGPRGSAATCRVHEGASQQCTELAITRFLTPLA